MYKYARLAVAAFVLAVFGALSFPATKAIAQSVGGSFEAAYYKVLNSAGAVGWRIRSDSAGILNIENLDTAQTATQAGIGVQVDSLTGAVRIPGYTSSQLTTLQSPGTGYMVWNTDASINKSDHALGRLMISTWTAGGAGTGAGAWTIY